MSFILNKDFLSTFCEVLDLPYHISPVSPSSPTTLQDRDQITRRIERIRCEHLTKKRSDEITTNSHRLCNALLLINEEFFHYLAMDQEGCTQIFQGVISLCDQIVDDEGSSFLDLLLATRMKMFSLLVTSGFFYEGPCHHWYLCDQWLRCFHRLADTKPGRVIIEDEFDPLLLPRQPGHNHLTRVPLLRHLSRLHALVMKYFHTQTHLQLSADKGARVCRMYFVDNTWTYRCLYQPQPPSGNYPFQHKQQKKTRKKKQPSGGAVTSLTHSEVHSVKISSVCCSSAGAPPHLTL
jgi:hypothetical protein